MARQGVALAGAALGMWIGGPMGAQIGFAVGSAAGNLLFPEKSPKPQKADTAVQASSYGTPIATLAGTDRTAGTLIWVKENKLQTKKVKQGGKGVGATSSATTYEYFASFAVLIGKGPIDGIRRIWCDTKLEADRSGARLEDVLANGGQSVTNLHAIDANLRIYLGTDDQMPDPAIQADRGAASTPAFRGLSYIVFDELPLADFGNRIPNISVEYVKNGALSYLNFNLSDVIDDPEAGFGGAISLDPYGPYVWHARLSDIIKINTANRIVEMQVDPTEQLDSNSDPVSILASGASADEFGNIYVAGTTVDCYRFDAVTLLYTGHVEVFGSSGVGYWRYRSFLSGSERWLFGIRGVSGSIRLIDAGRFEAVARELTIAGAAAADLIVAGDDRVLWVAIGSTIRPVSLTDDVDPDGAAPNGEYWPWTLAADAAIDLSATFGSAITDLRYYADENVILLANSTTFAKFDPVTLTIVASTTETGAFEAAEFERGPTNGKLWSKLSGAGGAFVELDVASMQITRSLAPSLWSGSGGTKNGATYDTWSDSLLTRYGVGDSDFRMLFLPRLDPLDVDRADVITQYSEEVNLDSGDIDVSLVTDTIQGNTIRRQSTGRDAMEPILQTGFIDAACVDRKVKFIPRGQSVTLTVVEDDLGAALEARDETQKLIETFAQEVTLPRRLLLRYVNREAQYDPGTQAASRSRLAVNTEEQMTFDTTEVMADDTARQVVDKLLYSTWNERTRLKFSLPPKYGKLTPADVINLPRGDVTYKVRLEKVDIGPFLECEGVPQEPATYSSSAIGAPSSIPEEFLQLLSPTQLFLIDSNLIRDEDDNGGHYLAIAPTIPDGLWSGAQIFKSSDAVSFFPSTSFFTSVDWGVAVNTLPDHHCSTTDRTSALTVQMTVGELASCTELEMLNGANAFLLGSGDDWELIQAADITDLGGGLYTLETFLRGRRGTEQAAGGHAGGDRLIVLSVDTMQRVLSDTEIGLERYYKPVSFGAMFNAIGAVTFTNTAMGRECYAVTHVTGSRDGSSNLTITWKRRSRIGGELDWGDGVADVPLAEDAEAYEVDILDGADVVRTITGLSSETASYSAANQTTDFGSPQSSIDIIVYQMSVANGRGRPAEATV